MSLVATGRQRKRIDSARRDSDYRSAAELCAKAAKGQAETSPYQEGAAERGDRSCGLSENAASFTRVREPNP